MNGDWIYELVNRKQKGEENITRYGYFILRLGLNIKKDVRIGFKYTISKPFFKESHINLKYKYKY